MSTMVYLEDLAALENAFSHSNSSAVLIFKHSAT